MGFFGDFSGSTQRRDQRQGYADSNQMIDSGYTSARGNINTGYDAAGAATAGARTDLTGGYGRATQTLNNSTSQAAGYLNPYAQQGGRANALYGDALGANGQIAQQNFGQNYAASDPFRQQNADFANESLMRTLNARGMSGGGYAGQAVARESLQRGSQDYGNYLNRLSGASAQGMQAATGMAGIYGDSGRTQAGYDYRFGSDMADEQGRTAGLATGRGNALAGLDVDQATTKAGNRINLANSLANSRGILGNNLLKVGELATKAFAGGR